MQGIWSPQVSQRETERLPSLEVHVLLGHLIPNHNKQLCTRKDILPPPRVPVCPPSNMEHTLSTISTANLLNVEKSRCWVQRLASMSNLEK